MARASYFFDWVSRQSSLMPARACGLRWNLAKARVGVKLPLYMPFFTRLYVPAGGGETLSMEQSGIAEPRAEQEEAHVLTGFLMSGDDKQSLCFFLFSFFSSFSFSLIPATQVTISYNAHQDKHRLVSIHTTHRDLLEPLRLP